MHHLADAQAGARSPGRTAIEVWAAEAMRHWGAKRGAKGICSSHKSWCFRRPARGYSTCTGGARVVAALAAHTAFSHVLGEGIAAAPWRPSSHHCGLHVIFLAA